MSSNVLGAFLGLLGLIAVGHFMTPGALGMLGVAIGVTGLLGFLGNMGFDKANTKRLSEGRDIATCLGTYRVLKSVLALGYIIVMVLVAIGWELVRGFASTTLPIVLIALGYQALHNLRNYPLSTFNAFRMAANAQVMAVSENLVKAPLMVLVALLFGALTARVALSEGIEPVVGPVVDALGTPDDALGGALLAVAYTAGMLASLGVGHFQMRRLGFDAGGFDPELAKSYKTFALPLALMVALMVIAKRIDIVMVGAFWSATESGYYFAAERFATVILIVPIAVRTLFFPLISELSRKGNPKRVHDVALMTQRIMSLIMILATMFVLLYAHEAIGILLNDRFLPVAPVLQLMALYVLVFAFSSIESAIVMGFDRPQVNARIAVLSVALNITLNLVFIPRSLFGVPLLGLGARGAVISTVLAQTLVLLLMLREAHRVTRRFHWSWSTPKHLLAAGLTAGLLLLAGDSPILGGVDHLFELVAAGALGVLVYLVILVALREVTRQDWVMMKEAFDPGKMAGYVRNELRSGEDDPD